MINKITDFLRERSESVKQTREAEVEETRKQEEAKRQKEETEKSARALAATEYYLRRAHEFIAAMPKNDFGQSDDALHNWYCAELSYLNLGFRAISIDKFIETDASPHKLLDLLCVERDQGEEPVQHAWLYKKYYLRRYESALALRTLCKESGNKEEAIPYPSTEKLAEMETKAKERKAKQ